MVSGANGDALLVQQGRDVVCMRAVHREGDDAALARGAALDADPVEALEPAGGVVQQGVLLTDQVCPVKGREVVKCSPEADGLHNGRRPGFEAHGGLAVGDTVLVHLVDHFAATAPGRKAVGPLARHVEHADARRPVEFVSGSDIEIAAEVLDIHRRMHRGLAAVEKDRNAPGVGQTNDVSGGRQCTQHVRHVGHGDQTHARCQHRFEGGHVQRAIFEHGRPFQDHALVFAQEVPGHDVGVVLHLGEDDLVPGRQGLPQAAGHEIERVCAAAGENDLRGRWRVEEGRDLAARRLIGIGCEIGKRVKAAMHVSIGRFGKLANGIENRLWLLCRGGIVEIDQRLAVDLACKDGEVRANIRDVEGAVTAAHCRGARHDRFPSARRFVSTQLTSAAERVSGALSTMGAK